MASRLHCDQSRTGDGFDVVAALNKALQPCAVYTVPCYQAGVSASTHGVVGHRRIYPFRYGFLAQWTRFVHIGTCSPEPGSSVALWTVASIDGRGERRALIGGRMLKGPLPQPEPSMQLGVSRSAALATLILSHSSALVAIERSRSCSCCIHSTKWVRWMSLVHKR